MEEIINDGYGELLGEIKTHIRSAQYDALRAVNKELIGLYWNIGKLIVEKQQGEIWGYSVVEKLGAIQSLRNWRRIFGESFQAFRASRLQIFGA